MGHYYSWVGNPFPLLLGEPSSALLSTAQAGGPPSVKMGWAAKTIIFQDVRGLKMTSFFPCKFFGQFVVHSIFFWFFYLVKSRQICGGRLGLVNSKSSFM